MTARVARFGGRPPNKFAADSKEPAAFVFSGHRLLVYFTSRSFDPASAPLSVTATLYFPFGHAVFFVT